MLSTVYKAMYLNKTKWHAEQYSYIFEGVKSCMLNLLIGFNYSVTISFKVAL